MSLENSSRKTRLKLKHRLENKGHTLTAVAELANVSVQAVSQYIHGYINESPRIEAAINDLLFPERKAA